MTQTIGFGGGCHWCTEAVFESIAGVTQVEQGWITSVPPDEAESEAVRVQFDPAAIDLRALMRVHLQTHASTSNHALSARHRSAVYTISPAQQAQVTRLLAEPQAEFDAALVTQALLVLRQLQGRIAIEDGTRDAHMHGLRRRAID